MGGVMGGHRVWVMDVSSGPRLSLRRPSLLCGPPCTWEPAWELSPHSGEPLP